MASPRLRNGPRLRPTMGPVRTRRPRTSDQQRPGLSPVSRSAAEWTQADCPSSTPTTPRPATSDHRPTTSGTVPCVPKRSGVDTGGLSLLESNHPPTSDQRPPTSNVRDCPLCPEAKRSGHWRTVPARIKPRPDQGPPTNHPRPATPAHHASFPSPFPVFFNHLPLHRRSNLPHLPLS